MTCCSSIASSSADCVFGDARLISSASTTLANTPPGRNSKSPRVRFHTETPVTSEGRRSGVNWMRRHVPPTERAIAFASDVLPTPGTSSMSRWPSAKRHTSARWIARRLPRITDSICSESSSNSVLEGAAQAGGVGAAERDRARGDSDPGELSGRGAACTGHVLQWGHEPAGTDSPRDGPTGAHATVPRVPACSGGLTRAFLACDRNGYCVTPRWLRAFLAVAMRPRLWWVAAAPSRAHRPRELVAARAVPADPRRATISASDSRPRTARWSRPGPRISSRYLEWCARPHRIRVTDGRR